MRSTILKPAIIFTITLIGGAYFGVILPVTLFLTWNFPVLFWTAWIFGFSTFLSVMIVKFEPEVRIRGVGARGDWTFIINAIVAVFAIGGG